jgi:hypothetical protein
MVDLRAWRELRRERREREAMLLDLGASPSSRWPRRSWP